MHAATRAAAAALAAALLPAAASANAPCRELPSQVPRRAPPAAVAVHNAALMARISVGATGAPERQWRHLVVHHTASNYSTVARIHRFHCDKFEDPDGIEYHFLIGNGRNMPDGYVAEARWPLQKRAIHLFHPERAPGGVAVAMVGNYEEAPPTPAQRRALTRLLATLADRYEVPPERITTHGAVDGRLTQCPGRKLPFEGIKKDVARLREE